MSFGTPGGPGQHDACDSGREHVVTLKLNERSGNIIENKGPSLLQLEAARATGVALTPHRGVSMMRKQGNADLKVGATKTLSTMGKQENADPTLRDRHYKGAPCALTKNKKEFFKNERTKRESP